MQIGMNVESNSVENPVGLASYPINNFVLKRQKFSMLLGSMCIVVSDITILTVCLMGSYLVRFKVAPFFYGEFSGGVIDSLTNLYWVPFLTVLIFAYEGLYYKRMPYWQEVKKIIRLITLSYFLAIAFMFLFKTSVENSRTLVAISYFFSVIGLPLGRLFTKRAIIKIGLWQKNVLVLGAGETAKLLIKAFNREKTLGYKIIGFLEDDANKKQGLKVKGQTYSILGSFSEAEDIISRFQIKDVIIAAPGLCSEEIIKLTNKLQSKCTNIKIIPDLFGIPLNGIKVQSLFDEKTLILSMHNNLESEWNKFVKRLFDLLIVTIFMPIVLPLLIVIYLIIAIEDRENPLFFGERLGKNGKNINCYKFRTMYKNNDNILNRYLEENPQAKEQWERYAKLKNYDPRVTKIGRILRKYSLDELPQLFNVLNGEMSLVGPRPYLLREKENMGICKETIIKTQPGITGLWQVSGRNEIDFEGRLKLDAWYVRNWSVWTDITILIRTISVVLSNKGAY